MTTEKWENDLHDVLFVVREMMTSRHRKYGAGNIARHGLAGIRVRLDDKLARLEAGNDDHPDESVYDTALDIVGYGLIYLMWLDGTWPGSEKR